MDSQHKNLCTRLKGLLSNYYTRFEETVENCSFDGKKFIVKFSVEKLVELEHYYDSYVLYLRVRHTALKLRSITLSDDSTARPNTRTHSDEIPRRTEYFAAAGWFVTHPYSPFASSSVLFQSEDGRYCLSMITSMYMHTFHRIHRNFT
ncbi:unnamed protein product [Heterobilharzia americana]|nr:unnamed protein product [Heterobilharzia americana]